MFPSLPVQEQIRTGAQAISINCSVLMHVNSFYMQLHMLS